MGLLESNKKLTSEECFAKAAVYNEAANRLGSDWTDDPLQKEMGLKVRQTLLFRGQKWKRRGLKIGKDEK